MSSSAGRTLPNEKHIEQYGSTAVPRPPYLTDAWLHAQGVRDIDALLSRLRPEDSVMRPDVLRAIKATRFSFARSLVERMCRERWRIELSSIDVDQSGAGYLIYTLDVGGRQMQFGAKSFPPQEVEWAGRIADAGFDFLGAIVDGPADRGRVIKELDEFATNMWMGRTDNTSYGWTA